MRKNKKIFSGLPFILALIIFLIDSLLTGNTAVWIFYLFPILIISVKENNKKLISLTAALSIIIIIAYIIKTDYYTFTSISDRIFGIISFWFTAFILITYREKKTDRNEIRLKKAEEIAHLGNWELDVINNKLTWSDETYRIFGLIPQEFGATYDAFLEIVHPDDRELVNEAYLGSIKEGKDSYEIEHRIIRKQNGEVRFVHEKCEHIRDNSGEIILSVGMVHDITGRKTTEKKLKKALNEKDLLLKEVYHRVKNNLQLISSIINLQSEYTHEPALKNTLRVINNRVKSISLLHSKLYQGENISFVNSAQYFKEIIESLSLSYEKPNINISYELDEVELNVNIATPLGIIINESISNSLKYAFPNEKSGKVFVKLGENENNVSLLIKDNGIGIPVNYIDNGSTGLGIQLINLLTDQIDGNITWDIASGTSILIEFRN